MKRIIFGHCGHSKKTDAAWAAREDTAIVTGAKSAAAAGFAF